MVETSTRQQAHVDELEVLSGASIKENIAIHVDLIKNNAPDYTREAFGSDLEGANMLMAALSEDARTGIVSILARGRKHAQASTGEAVAINFDEIDQVRFEHASDFSRLKSVLDQPDGKYGKIYDELAIVFDSIQVKKLYRRVKNGAREMDALQDTLNVQAQQVAKEWLKEGKGETAVEDMVAKQIKEMRSNMYLVHVGAVADAIRLLEGMGIKEELALPEGATDQEIKRLYMEAHNSEIERSIAILYGRGDAPGS